MKHAQAFGRDGGMLQHRTQQGNEREGDDGGHATSIETLSTNFQLHQVAKLPCNFF